MKIFIGADHAGYEAKEKLKVYLSGLGHEVKDFGAFTLDKTDDYPDFIRPVAEAVAEGPELEERRGIILGASGQGEAICANRVHGARAVVFYGGPAKSQTDMSGNILDMIASTRMHNDANILALGMRFLNFDEAQEAVKIFLATKFSEEERHVRRINKF